jgi:hypothetical protein
VQYLIELTSSKISKKIANTQVLFFELTLFRHLLHVKNPKIINPTVLKFDDRICNFHPVFPCIKKGISSRY